MYGDGALGLPCNEEPSALVAEPTDCLPSDVYRPGLSMRQLVEEVRALLGEQRRAERLVCRYLADLADRIEDRKRNPWDLDGFGSGFVDVYEAARSLFDMTVRQGRERVRVGRALRSLPHIEQALVAGTLAYGRVREITRVATAETERKWLLLGQELPFSTLERRVIEASTSGGRTQGGHTRQNAAQPACIRWLDPNTVELRMALRAEQWAILERAMEGARRAASEEGLLADSEALASVAKEALAHQLKDEPNEVNRTVVLYECRHCQRLEVETGASAVELGDAAAQALGCGAVQRDLRCEGRIVRRGGPIPNSVRRAVHLRDRAHCRVPGCTRRRYVDVHHIQEQARGGEHSRHNCLVLCDNHHAKLHAGELILSGDAEDQVEFCDASGQRLGSSLPPAARALASHATGAVTRAGSSASGGVASDAPPAVTRAGSSASGGVASDAPPAVTRAGSSASGGVASDAPPAVTRAGSLSDALVEQIELFGLDPTCARVLAVMGNRGGWTVDSLVEATGQSVQVVLQTKLILELQGMGDAFLGC